LPDKEIASVDDDGEKKVIGMLDNATVVVFSKLKNPENESEVIRFFSKSPFQEIEMKNKDDNARVFINRKGKAASEFYIGFGAENTFVLMSFFGDFKIENAEELKEVAKVFKEIGKIFMEI
jgi:hypothetical protein